MCVQKKGIVYKKNKKQHSEAEVLWASVCDGEGQEESEETVWFTACSECHFASLTTEFFYFQGAQTRALKAFIYLFIFK